MNTKAKALTPVLLLLIVLSFCLAVTALFFLKNEKDAKLALEKKLEQSDNIIKTLEAKLDEANKLVLQLNEKMKDSDTRIVSLTTQLDEAKASADSIQGERDTLQAELDSLKGSKEELIVKLSSAQKELEEVKTKLDAAIKEKDSLDQNLKDLQAQTGVQLDKIVVSPTGIEEGKILVVNEEFDFVVINLGQEANVSVGQPVYIYQGDKFLGEGAIEKVQEAMSVVKISDPNIKSAVKVGDIIKLKQ